MRALSLWEPWASLVVAGIKRVETRPWHTGYRGTIAVHATAVMPAPALAMCRDPRVAGLLRECGRRVGGLSSDKAAFDLGCIIGLVDVVSVAPSATFDEDDLMTQACGDDVDLKAREYLLGNYEPGRFVWRLENPRKLSPILCKGRQRLWRLSPDAQARVDAQLGVLA